MSSYCLMLPLFLALGLLNPATLLAQSSVIATFERPPVTSVSNPRIPSSITSSQVATEAMLSQPVATIGIRNDETLLASDVFESLNATVFIDLNLEGVFDLESEMDMKAGVSTGASLKSALKLNDSVITVESDGSISVISIDDEWEPDYLRNVTYDVTGVANSLQQAQKLLRVIESTIHSDSWEQNGGGNGTASLYRINSRILMTVNQSYTVHLAIRSHLQTVSRLSRSSIVRSPSALANRSTSSSLRMSASAPSSVVAVPAEQTTSALRSRRGFARPGSGTSGGFGGAGFGGGGVF